MTRRRPAIRGALSVIAGPGVMAGFVPWLLTGWRSTRPPVYAIALGAVMIAAGASVLLAAAARFVFEGHGTIAPFAPTDQLVIGGFYRYVRNPMYVAVVSIILGEALLLGRIVLVVWAALFWVATASFVHFYEERTLTRRYGDQYTTYRRSVRAWWPRVRPWSP